MPRSFLVKKQHAKCGSRNWGDISDDQRGDFYIPECLDRQQCLPDRGNTMSGKDAWERSVDKGFRETDQREVQPVLKTAKVQSAYTQGHFLCSSCSKIFPLHRMLTRHLKCHSAVKRHICNFCGKGFNDTFDLKRHMRTHTGIRPYKCDLCEKAFTQRCSLESHLKKIHSIHQNYAYRERRSKIFVCEDCGFTANQGDTYFLHIRDHHPTSPLLRKYLRKQGMSFQDRLDMLLFPRFV
ncbi:putative transcription factor ovo-like protein 3 [Chiloscyllium punctatum]|uniref:putative transcription factor ovo-like protein 3 n=1 Tax=Chiloscyllium punctatum TaxID=137246 RepID=UPI003B63ACD4